MRRSALAVILTTAASLAPAAIATPALAQRQPAPLAQRQQPAPAAASPVVTVAPSGPTRTLQDALALTYSTNPALQAARAQLRATDEGVPQALAGWRPQVQLSASAGYADGSLIQQGAPIRPSNRGVNTETFQIQQPLYRGGQTRAATNQAENKVIAQRATLIAAEQTAFLNAVNAFVGVIQAQQVLTLNTNNEQVLTRQLQATQDRFRVGEITRTDVAQAEAALAGASATRKTAEGNLQTARATYRQVIGEDPARLIEPQPLRLPAGNLPTATDMAEHNNPNVITALFNDAAAKDNFDLQYGKLLPTLSLQGSLNRAEDVQTKGLTTNTAQILAAITVPIYQGGSEYSAIRQARQQQEQTRKLIADARRTAVQQVTSAWQTYVAARATIDSTREQIRSNEIALEGVQREAIVGSRTTLDVLNAEQTLLNSRVTLVQNLASLITASYQVASAVGRLTARDLALHVPLYDDTAYYKAVKNKLVGTGDYATGQPGR